MAPPLSGWLMRLFFALLPPAPLCEALRDIMNGVDGAHWQRRDQLHLTARFVGEASAHQADELAVALLRLTPKVPALRLAGLGLFENSGRPTALWIRAAPPERLAQLHRKLDRLCQTVGLKAEARAYLPHVTLARLPRTAGPVQGWLVAHAGRSFGPVPFARLALMESHLTASGSDYHQIASVRLD